MPPPPPAKTETPNVHPENSLVGTEAKARPPPGSATGADPLTPIPCTVVDVKRRAADGAIVAFVRWRDFERRFGEWLTVDRVVRDHRGGIKSGGGAAAGNDGDEGDNTLTPTTGLWCYEGISTEMRAGFKTTMEFLEERLRRDMKSPNSVHRLHYAGHVMSPWFYSPFGTLYPQFSPATGVLHDAYVCPFTLAPFESAARLTRHLQGYVRSGAPLRIPGKEVYCDDEAGLSLMELDGRQHAVFCRNVFLLAKCFLECKLVGHDTDLYTIYVVAVHSNKRAPGFLRGLPPSANPKLFAGYYSYERGSVDNNLACIVTLPCFQGHGLGRFLIEASYAVGYRKGIVGSPERPLSELGRAAYDRYWSEKVWRWVIDEAVGAVEQRRPVQPAAYDGPPPGGQHSGTQDDLAKASSAVLGDGADDGTAASDGGDTGALAVMRVTTHDIAKKLRLDSGDVLETLLRLGLIHRTESRSLKLLAPPALAANDIARVSASLAPFRPELLQELSASGPHDGSGR